MLILLVHEVFIILDSTSFTLFIMNFIYIHIIIAMPFIVTIMDIINFHISIAYLFIFTIMDINNMSIIAKPINDT